MNDDKLQILRDQLETAIKLVDNNANVIPSIAWYKGKNYYSAQELFEELQKD